MGIVDNDSLALRALAAIVRRDSLFHLLWATNSGSKAVQYCQTSKTHPDVMLIDMALDGFTGIDLYVRIIRTADPPVAIGVTAHSPSDFVRAAKQSGFVDVLSKSDKQLLRKIHDVSVRETNIVVPASSRVPGGKGAAGAGRRLRVTPLTGNELRVLELYSEGLKTREVMQEMGVAKTTVESYRTRALRKLNAKTLAQATYLCAGLHLF